MPDQDLFWERWEERLSRWKLQHMVAAWLENGAAWNLLLAQCLHGLQPFAPTQKTEELEALALLLEDPQSSAAFAGYLRKEQPC